MAESNHSEPAASIGSRRLSELLETLIQRGVTQQEIASKAKVPPGYLSDIKHDRRPLTELVARRLSEEFEVSYEWLLGRTESMERAGARSTSSSSLWLPILPHPIEGDPKMQTAWDGTMIELAGMVKAKVAAAHLPYVLRFAKTDRKNRLQEGDLVLMSQSRSEEAEIHVVKEGKDLYLARRIGNQWQRVAQSEKGRIRPLPQQLPDVGHAVGILWGRC